MHAIPSYMVRTSLATYIHGLAYSIARLWETLLCAKKSSKISSIPLKSKQTNKQQQQNSNKRKTTKTACLLVLYFLHHLIA